MVQKVPFTQTSGNTMTIGTGSSRVIMGADSGNLKIQDSDSNTSIIEAGKGIQNPSIVTIVANNASLPTSGLSAGDLAWSTANSHFFVSNGTGWYKMTIVNEAPTITLSTDAITLGSSGNTVNITYTLVEPEGTSTTVTVSNSGIADTNTATITHTTANNTITVTNTKAAQGTWSGTVTATVSDGVNLGTDSFTISISYLDLTDSQDSYFKLSADGNNLVNSSFVDSSTTGTTHTITGAGNAMQGSFSPYSPTGYSTLFDGVADYFDVAASGDFLIGTGAFTLEAWVNFSSSSSDTYYKRVFMLDGPSGNNNGNLQIIISASTGGAQAFTATGDLSIEGNIKIADDKWHHIAVVRSGTTVTLYVDGVIDGTATYSSSIGTQNSSQPRPRIGSYNGSNGDFSGFIHDVRLVVGTAVYTAAFTPPTSALTAITNTKLLTCNKGYLQHANDSSGRNHFQTKAGNVTAMPFTPYDVTDGYTASTHGGSVKLDGSGDYISVPTSADFNFGTGDYTIEFWIYPTYLPSDGANRTLIDYRTTSNQNVANLWLHKNGHIYLWFNGAYAISGSAGAIKINHWYHIALVRNSSKTTLYINGIQEGSVYSDSNTYVQGGTFYIGKYFSNSSYDFPGYISDVRVIKGDSRYPFLPVAETLTTTTSYQDGITVASGDVELLMAHASSFTDGSTNSHSLTNNGATIDSDNYPASGMKSISFSDGDYVDVAAGSSLAPGTGDFTLEFWFNSSSNALDGSKNRRIWLFDGPSGNTNDAKNLQFLIAETGASGVVAGSIMYYHQSTNDYLFYKGNTTNICDNAWHHVAIVRKSGVLMSFVDGRHDSSTSFDADISPNSGNARPRIGSYDASSGGFTGNISNMRYSSIAVYDKEFTPPSSALTEVSNTKLLLNMSNAKIYDEGGRFNVTLVNNTKSSTGQTRVSGESSVLFDGSADSFQIENVGYRGTTGPENTQFFRSSEDFTIEGYLYYPSTPAKDNGVNPVIYNLDYEDADAKYDEVYIDTDNNNYLKYVNDNDGGTDFSYTNNVTFVTGAWKHFAVVKKNDLVRVFYDGDPGTNAPTGHQRSTAYNKNISVGAYKATSGGIAAYLADFRITKGVGKYPFDTFNQRQTLTTSTSLQSGITTTASNVKILGAHTSTLTTNDGNTGGGFTVNSGVTASAFAPIGGMRSAYFDNSSNATMIHNNHASSGTGVFTAEMWVWNNDTDTYAPLVGFVTDASGYGTADSYRLFYINGSGALIWWNTTDFAQSPNSQIQSKTWHHVAVTRASDNYIRLYVDGQNVVKSGSTFTENMNNYTRIVLGRHASQYFKGYISNFRITNQVLYTHNFTPSSSAING